MSGECNMMIPFKDYIMFAAKIEEIENTLSICHPSYDKDVIINLHKELDNIVSEIKKCQDYHRKNRLSVIK